MKKKYTPGDIAFNVINYVFLCFLSLIFLYPILYSFFASISDPVQLLSHTGPLYKPLGFSTVGYRVVFQNPNISTGYINTLLYTSVGTLASLLCTIMGAYALSKKRYKLKKFATFFIVFTMYFSGGMIPHFLLVRGLGMYDSPAAMIVPGVINTWNMIVRKWRSSSSGCFSEKR